MSPSLTPKIPLLIPLLSCSAIDRFDGPLHSIVINQLVSTFGSDGTCIANC